MFKLRVSNTLSSSAIAFWLSGPGMAVLIIGPAGSSGKNGSSPADPDVFAAAVAPYDR
jgi:hypothetical protein